MGARKARQTKNSIDPKSSKRASPKRTTVSLTIQVVDPDGKRLDGIHVALKQGEKVIGESFANKQGEVEFTGLTTGEDYTIFVNDEEKEEIVGPRGDDEQEVEYDGEYKPRARADESEEESDEAADDSDEGEIDDEDDVSLLGDDAADLEL